MADFYSAPLAGFASAVDTYVKIFASSRTAATLLKHRMLYVVEIRLERPLAKVLSDLREWLDAERFEPVTFRCTTENDCIICRLKFQFEREAAACAAVFNGTVTSLGQRQASGPLSGQTSIGRPQP